MVSALKCFKSSFSPQGLFHTLCSPASRFTVKVGPITHPLPGEAGFCVGLQEFKARQRQGSGTSFCPSKGHRSSVESNVLIRVIVRDSSSSTWYKACFMQMRLHNRHNAMNNTMISGEKGYTSCHFAFIKGNVKLKLGNKCVRDYI